ncbi:MAG: hypothetical protein N2C13_00385 [Chloroflexota bacterium]
MKRHLLRIIPLLLLTMVIGWSPAFADGDDLVEYKIKVINRSKEGFFLFMQGPEDYTFEVARESSNKTKVLEGKYQYFYEVCDGDFAGEVTVKDSETVFEIYDCRLQPVPTKFVIESHFDGTTVVEMTGPLQVEALTEDYTVNASLGNNRYDIDSGDYFYSYEACDTTFSGQIKILKNGTTKLRLTSCESLTRRAIREEFGPLDPVKFRVANRFAVDIDITLVGPQSYFIHAQPGINRYEVVAGTYNYIFAAFGLRYEGIITISPNGDTMLTIPFSVSSTEKM